jgi:hypothetical protein
VLNPPGYMWYYTPFAIGFALVLGLAADFVVRWVYEKNRKAGAAVLVCLALIALVGAVKLPLTGLREPKAYKYNYYREASSWLNEVAEPGDSVGCLEIGVLGYYYRHGPVIDGLGLVTPGVNEQVAQGDFSWWIHEYEPDFIIFREPFMEANEYAAGETWFQDQYDLEVILGERQKIGIYRRKGTEPPAVTD